jgi:hypothetical protein
MPAQRNQRSTPPATTRVGSSTARRGNDGNGRCSNQASYWPVGLSIGTAIDLLPGSETSQRLHTIWHETVLRIDIRTAR